MNEIFGKTVKIIDVISKNEYNKIGGFETNPEDDITEEGYLVALFENKADKNFYWVSKKSAYVEVGLGQYKISSNIKLMKRMTKGNIEIVYDNPSILDCLRSKKKNDRKK